MNPPAPSPSNARGLALLLLAGALAGCGGGGDTGGKGPDPVPPGIYVSAADGSDLYVGTLAQPLKTLTAALALAQAGDTVWVAPGTYDAALGEVFPLLVPAGVTVEGDIAQRGAGPTPTAVTGGGATAGTFPSHVCLLLGEGAAVRGLSIAAGSTAYAYAGAWIEDVTVEIADCTFGPASYVGAILDSGGASQIRDCTFQATSYGVYMIGGAAGLAIEGCTFDGPSYGIDMVGSGAVSIENNQFATSASSAAGIQVQSSSPSIQGNTFGPGNFGAGACVVSAGTPLLRDNTFTGSLGVLVQAGGNADLGTAADAGLNSFAALTGFAVKHEGGATVQAHGNTWQHVPPTAGQDIVVTGAGSVVYGPGANDKVP